jgi:flavin-dependent dehydrogenase
VASELVLSSRVVRARHTMPWDFRVVPRRVLDARLLQAAVDAGAVWERRRVGTVASPTGVRLAGDLEAEILIGADGAESVVRRSTKTRYGAGNRVAVALRGYGPTTSQAPRIVSQGRGWPAYAWEFPIGNGVSNIGYVELPRGRAVSREQLLSAAAGVLPDAAAGVQEWKGRRLSLAGARPAVPDGRVLLAGDAASLINPTSGEGILDAIVSGALAGEAALLGPSAGAAYRASLRRALGRHQRHAAVATQLCRIDASWRRYVCTWRTRTSASSAACWTSRWPTASSGR